MVYISHPLFFRPQYAKVCEHVKCTGSDHVDKELKRIIALGGEGLMIRQPGSKYERTRSKTLLKIKKFFDAEVWIFVRYVPSFSFFFIYSSQLPYVT